MRKLPPLTALRAFEAAARRLSFKEAAQELGLTPTAISHQVQALEQFCGKSLFLRRPRPLSLTPEGAQLLPAISEGLDRFADGLKGLNVEKYGKLRVTTTNEFAARWLMPRLQFWRRANPDIGLDIVGTSTVLDLGARQADIAIRYTRLKPEGYATTELGHDTYYAVASPKLVGHGPAMLTPRQLSTFPLIEAHWPDDAANPPMWREWVTTARKTQLDVPDLTGSVALSFHQDIHVIEAALAGQGIALCSDILIKASLLDGSLRQISPIALAGYAFYSVHCKGHPREDVIGVFDRWISDLMDADK